MSDHQFLALIPARGGSKRLHRKNVRSFAGVPLIARSITAALESSRIERIVVSTDDRETAAVALESGAEVPFLRSADLSDDEATTEAVVLDAVERLRAVGDRSTHVVLLQPTSPLRTSDDIDAAIAVLEQREADAVVSVCPAECPAAWINPLPDDRSMAEFLRSIERGRRSQDHQVSFRLNGAVYIYDVDRALRQKDLNMEDNAFAYVMPRSRSIDIDDEHDFVVAEALAQRPR